jgi:hypothetical protein
MHSCYPLEPPAIFRRAVDTGRSASRATGTPSPSCPRPTSAAEVHRQFALPGVDPQVSAEPLPPGPRPCRRQLDRPNARGRAPPSPFAGPCRGAGGSGSSRSAKCRRQDPGWAKFASRGLVSRRTLIVSNRRSAGSRVDRVASPSPLQPTRSGRRGGLTPIKQQKQGADGRSRAAVLVIPRRRQEAIQTTDRRITSRP